MVVVADAQRPSAPGLDALKSARWIRVIDSELPTTDLGLDPGETAAILLAEGLQADLLPIDERMGVEWPRREALPCAARLASLSRRGGLAPFPRCDRSSSSW